jgi:hypothetical protein
MLRHIIAYSDSLEKIYTHPYAVHFFDDKGEITEEELSKYRIRAMQLLAEHQEAAFIRYVGAAVYPNIEYKSNEEEAAVYIAKFEYIGEPVEEHILDKVIVVKELPKDVQDMLIKERLKVITVDSDYKSAYQNSLEKLIHMYALNAGRYKQYLNTFSIEKIKVHKTYQGFHIRIKPDAQLRDITDILEIRKELRDDYSRIKVDELYINAGFPFLANMLFNAKYFIEQEGKEYDFKYYKEEEVSIREPQYQIDYRYFLPFSVSEQRQYTVNTSNGIPALVTVQGSEMHIFGLLTGGEVDKIKEEILRTYYFEEYITALIKKEYGMISSRLDRIFDDYNIKITVTKELVTINVPLELKPVMGLLIGKNGKNVKAVSDVIKIPIKIVLDERMEEKASALAVGLTFFNETWRAINDAILWKDRNKMKQIIKDRFGTDKYVVVFNDVKRFEVFVPVDDKVYVLTPMFKDVRVARADEIKRRGIDKMLREGKDPFPM